MIGTKIALTLAIILLPINITIKDIIVRNSKGYIELILNS